MKHSAPVHTSISKKRYDELSPELRDLYIILYEKISSMIGADLKVNLMHDPTSVRIIIGTSMVIVEKFRNTDGNGWSGPEKKKYALVLIKYVVRDLADAKKIDKEIADELILNIDFWGGVAMDVAVDAANEMIEVGQEFVKDAKAEGCGSAFGQNCNIL